MFLDCSSAFPYTRGSHFMPGIRSWKMSRKSNTNFSFKAVFFLGVRGLTILSCIAVFLNRRATAWCRALAVIIPGCKRREETTVCYKISLVMLITTLNVILYLSTCHTVYISVLILFMIMPLIINNYVSLTFSCLMTYIYVVPHC